jgi:hypothetical protein
MDSVIHINAFFVLGRTLFVAGSFLLMIFIFDLAFPTKLQKGPCGSAPFFLSDESLTLNHCDGHAGCSTATSEC